ncbi:MarR family transcriptional regulator [Hyphococcus flavus]|uniref:MarR family transcriptional regulator n=1 Tax=Hyphococcus flavus TaxID=1866326 RepID=A0AAE9ZBK6_9PROT|nr:MarR family transcriptional regulator [Hyphococcus flavus]WDI31628.1 MarR family transcriptional regulator [Hyphococcus flavus]
MSVNGAMREVIGESASAVEKDPEALETGYLQLLHLVERLHRQLLDVIKDELERIGQTDINSVQALLLYNIGDAELTPGELRSRGHYLGSNVSYNLKQLVEKNYIRDERSNTDRRSKRVSLTETGLEVRDSISALFERQLSSVEQVGGVNNELIESTNKTLQRLERFWADQVRFRL